MKAKLTLLVDKGVIADAKEYAAEHDTSLSRMFEEFLLATFSKVSSKKPKRRKKSHPDVARLRGIISLPPNYDYKLDRMDYLVKKYGL
jgi:Family of unknown function (DUF6364)